ncbi:PREDICTED: protein IWS1 homolog [Ipomoea nil]|uniref:protein IWS1 homolog n=1 Tax=Ipomoea nil TaxID=35883 RepID=UPI000901A924|nr:PREDICTED: protein IWS1 homolog [Ipomoea nil]
MTNRTLGKEKAPICIELNKPPLDPAFEEEMKQLRYALLLSKIKTTLEKEHQNDPNCNVSGSKDEHGREIDSDKEDESDEEDEDDTDVEDADDEHDDDDDDNDDNDDLGNDRDKRADPNYDSKSPLLIGPDCDTFPQRSPLEKFPSDSDDTKEASQQDKEISTAHPEDLSRAIIPHIQPMDETPIKREEALVREGKMDASPILLSSASGGKKEAPPQDEQMDTSPTNVEEDSSPESPRIIMNLMRETVHAAETIHQQYLTLRQRDTKALEDLSKKVDLLMAAQTQSQPPPQEQPQPPPQAQPDQQFNDKVAKKLYDFHTTINKVARQQHELKHSHFSLKERVDLACTKIDTSQDNTYQLGQYALQILGYIQDILIAVNKSSNVPPTTCADDAKKGEKRNNDDKDKDDDHPRDNMRERSPRETPKERRSPSHTPRDSGQRNTKSSHPPSKSRGHHSSQSRYYSNRGRSQPRSLKPRQSYDSEAQYIFTGLSKREKDEPETETHEEQQSSEKCFEGYNVPVWLKTKDNHTRQHHISTQNERIKRENRELWAKHEEEVRRREHELEERERVKKLIEDLSNVTKNSPQGVIYNAAFKVHTESEKSYKAGMNYFELISWWKAGIVEGRNIREADNNYTSMNIKGKHEDLVKTNPIKIFRKRINEEIDFTRMLKQQKERDTREHEEAEQQKSKLLEL